MNRLKGGREVTFEYVLGVDGRREPIGIFNWTDMERRGIRVRLESRRGMK